MKKYLAVLLLTAALPIASHAELDPREDYDYPGFSQDKAVLDNYYHELDKDLRHRGSPRTIKNDKKRIDKLEDKINQKQDQFEDHLRSEWRRKHGSERYDDRHDDRRDDHRDDRYDDRRDGRR